MVESQPRIQLLRFADLKARGVVQSWATLYRWIESEGFPPGQKLGPKIRVWRGDEVEKWVSGQGGEDIASTENLSVLDAWKRKRNARQT